MNKLRSVYFQLANRTLLTVGYQNVNMFQETIFKFLTRSSNAVFTVSDWYLLSNGHDTSSCGASASKACRTLDWLLDRFYRTSYKIKSSLHLILDSNLIITPEITVSISRQNS